MLAAFASGFPPEVVEEFAVRPEAIDFVEGIGEVWRRVEGLTPEDCLAFMAHPGEMAMPWRPGVDQNVMDGVAAAVYYTTQALHQGRLGQWPAMSPTPGAIKLSWSMAQLVDVIESMLPDLERKAAEQEARAAETPRLPWFDIIKPGTMPLPRDTWGQDLRG